MAQGAVSHQAEAPPLALPGSAQATRPIASAGLHREVVPFKPISWLQTTKRSSFEFLFLFSRCLTVVSRQPRPGVSVGTSLAQPRPGKCCLSVWFGGLDVSPVAPSGFRQFSFFLGKGSPLNIETQPKQIGCRFIFPMEIHWASELGASHWVSKGTSSPKPPMQSVWTLQSEQNDSLDVSKENGNPT